MKKRIYPVLYFVCIFFIGCNQNKFDDVRFFIDSNNIEKAELILDNMNKSEKKSFDYNYLKGIVLVKKSIAGYKREALNYFLKANEFDSNKYLNNLMISKMFIEVNDLSNAEIFAENAKKLFAGEYIDTCEEDVYYLLAKILFMKKNYKKALENLELSVFQDDGNVVFLKTEISDFLNGQTLLDTLVEKYKKNDLMSDKLHLSYLNYLFLNNRIKDAEVLADELLKNESVFLKYYGCLTKAFCNMLDKNFESAYDYIEKSYDYNIDDSLFLRYKMKFFYSYLTEDDLIKVFNSFLIYKFFYEKNEREEITAKKDLSEIFEYFEDDVYFALLKDRHQ
ncbi:MAG: tetratricopeptide repeat protein [Treponema sp.]